MTLKVMPQKQPAEKLDYDFVYTSWLPTGDTISTATVTVDTGLTLESFAATTNTVKVWLSGGTSGNKYKVTCRITTAGGRIKEDEMIIPVKEQ